VVDGRWNQSRMYPNGPTPPPTSLEEVGFPPCPFGTVSTHVAASQRSSAVSTRATLCANTVILTPLTVHSLNTILD